MSADNKVVLITGGGSGLGRNMAKRIANLGVKKLILWDVNQQGLEETKSMIRGCEVELSVVDVSGV